MISEPSGRRPDPARARDLALGRGAPRREAFARKLRAGRTGARAYVRPRPRARLRHPPTRGAPPRRDVAAERGLLPRRGRALSGPRVRGSRGRQQPSATRRVGSAGLAGTANVRREYLRAATLEALWSDLDAALRSELRDTSLEQWFKYRHAAWNVVGRVCFHLAENKADDERPFAFLATYSTRLSSRAQPQHRPLGQAVRDFASDKGALLSLLLPVQRASEESALAKELVDNGKLFRTLAWTPAEALRFLREVPAFEAAGIVVRVPAWWKKRSRVGVEVKLGGRKPAGLGLDALVDFDVRLALDGEPLNEKEWRALAAQDHGLALVRGRWVEIDRDKLEQVLAHWKEAQDH